MTDVAVKRGSNVFCSFFNNAKNIGFYGASLRIS